MDLKNIISLIENNEQYIEWKKNNPETYLVHVFKMLDQPNKDEVQIGYYNKTNKLITTFVLNEKDNEINQNPESETFKETEDHIKELDLNKVEINFATLMNKIEKIRQEKYTSHLPDKTFFILQNIDNQIMWNFTIIAKTLSIVNIKIDATNGNVIDDKLTSVFDFKANQ